MLAIFVDMNIEFWYENMVIVTDNFVLVWTCEWKFEMQADKKTFGGWFSVSKKVADIPNLVIVNHDYYEREPNWTFNKK